MVRAFNLSLGFLQVPGEIVTQVASNRFGRRAGRGGDVTPGPCAKGQRDKGGLSRALPFSLAFGRWRRCCPCAAAPSRLIGRNRSPEPSLEVFDPLGIATGIRPRIPA